MQMPDPSVSLKKVSFSYGKTGLLKDFSLCLSSGLTALLGPNGAGKSTVMALMATVLRSDSGDIEVCGHNVMSAAGRAAARRLIGWLPQRFDLVGSMTLRDTVAYAAWCNGVDGRLAGAVAERSLAIVELEDRARERVRRLSGGQRQRLGLAAVLSHDPRVLILDEPTVGLDPEHRVRIRRYLHREARDRVVLVSTHLIEDATRLCKELVILNEGQIRFKGAVDALVQVVPEETNQKLASPAEMAYEVLLWGDADARAENLGTTP